MLIIKVDTKDGSQPTLSMVTFAQDRDQIGPRAIRAVASTLSYARAEDMRYCPAEDPDDAYIDDFDGQILDSGDRPTHYNVYVKETASMEDTIVSGIFADTLTPEDLENNRPHTVMIVGGQNPREISFPCLHSADLFAYEYDANAATMAETLQIRRDQDGEIVKIYP